MILPVGSLSNDSKYQLLIASYADRCHTVSTVNCGALTGDNKCSSSACFLTTYLLVVESYVVVAATRAGSNYVIVIVIDCAKTV